ncbi:MAG TPA: LysR family transcriptional regulator [Candidatus Kapabacteria bacterium]|nr:LysR family transcriptional regulator [Candidatus Kapabacteria bacterium]
MTLQQIEICEHLVSLGSINAVARRIGVTQPAVSTALMHFERELGVQLFIRSKLGVMLTRKGKELFPLFRTMLRTESEILSNSRSLPTDKGSIKIAGRQGFMQYVFPHLYTSLRRAFPLITIDSIVSAEQAEIIEALTTGRVDLAFAPRPKIKSVSSEILFRDPVFIGVAKKEAKRVSKKALQKMRFCLPSTADRLRKPLEQLIRTVNLRPDIALESDDYTLLGKLVLNGEFAGPIYGHMLLDEKIRHGIAPIPLFKPLLYRELTILYRRDDLLPHIRSAKELFRSETEKLLSATIKSSLNQNLL